MKRPCAETTCYALVWALFLALAAALCVIVQWRYAIFRNDVDLGIFTQVIDSVGAGFSSTVEGSANHLLTHWSPIVVVGWPFLKTFGPIGLEYLQAIMVAATLFPVWGLARARFAPLPALALVAVAALYPLLCANGVGDFHEMAFVPFLSATLVYALDRRRWTMALVAALLLACTKEDQFVILASNGAMFAAIARKDRDARRVGLGLCGLAIVVALAYFGIVRPMLNAHVSYQSLSFYDWRGARADGGVSLAALLLSRLRYVLVALGPLAFLPCISRYGLFLIPAFVEIFAAQRPVAISPGAHYSALLTGYALMAFVDGVARLRPIRPRLSASLVGLAAVAAFWIAIFASPMEYWYYLYRRPDTHDARLEATLRALPPRADVGSEDPIFSHLGLNPRASIDFNGQKWFVYDATAYSQRWHDVDEPAVRVALTRHAYFVRRDRDGIVVLERANP